VNTIQALDYIQKQIGKIINEIESGKGCNRYPRIKITETNAIDLLYLNNLEEVITISGFNVKVINSKLLFKYLEHPDDSNNYILNMAKILQRDQCVSHLKDSLASKFSML